jgi:tRNA dimethylallyltransferase
MDRMHKGVILIAGPTASGKSAAALGVARQLEDVGGGVIINADSMQVYEELEIITARPDARDMSQAPHRLYGVLSGSERCSVARWRDMAVAEIVKAHLQGRWPILVGGTGLYFKVLMEGIAEIPEIPQSVTDDMTRHHVAIGAEAFHAELAERDPDSADRIRPSDKQRLIRAAGVLAATGKTLGQWQAEGKENGGLDLPMHRLALMPPREVLYGRCDARLQAMFYGGAQEEVRALNEMKLDPSLPIMKAVGVPEILRYQAGEIDAETAVSTAQQSTRRYAKRQMTWIRNQMKDWKTVSEQDSERISAEIFSFIRQDVLTEKS